MLNNGKLLYDFKEEIKQKYSYDDDLAETIAMTAESLIDYFGVEYESLILEAISSCKYVIAKKEKEIDGKLSPVFENVYDVLKRENMILDIKGTTISDGDLKRASGVYTSVPKLSFTDGKYNIDKIDRIIVLGSHFNKDNPASLGLIAHETMHMIKSYINEFTIDGDKLVERRGLGKTEYKLTNSNDGINLSLEKETGVGIEEGLNSYDELKLVRTAYDSNYETYGYAYQRVVAGILIDNINLDEYIKKAQLTGNTEELKNIFDENILGGYDEFIRDLDSTVELEYKRFEYILDIEKSKEYLNELDKIFEERLVPKLQSIKKSLENSQEKNYSI